MSATKRQFKINRRSKEKSIVIVVAIHPIFSGAFPSFFEKGKFSEKDKFSDKDKFQEKEKKEDEHKKSEAF